MQMQYDLSHGPVASIKHLLWHPTCCANVQCDVQPLSFSELGPQDRLWHMIHFVSVMPGCFAAVAPRRCQQRSFPRAQHSARLLIQTAGSTVRQRPPVVRPAALYLPGSAGRSAQQRPLSSP